ncbi:prephenate dehydrogenase [Tessaracoccus palaemonis]|uniref:Prephenate dehydrogenase n=1 Tax=Tessaracoccus palaemonis TaxID=2829499 RepID=A0ABX8SKK1_9ACTN|nr:prephenate dehydrogenase [Tessaracoccus palaemonis]QXT62955.1 prephenate dehydrogenase [Tessaracoccus palaemonis]
MGLRYTDLDSWRSWQASRRRLHVLKAALTPSRPAPTVPALEFWTRGQAPRVLVACDSTSPTNHYALVVPFSSPEAPDAVLAHPAGLDLGLEADGWRRVPPPTLDAVDTVVSIGDHLQVGAWAHGLALARGWRQVVVQHGLLTPFSPPPPTGARFLAWSQADADYIREGRPDLEPVVVGSPLLTAAAAIPAPHVSRFTTPVFLGQLHGAELGRWSMTRSVTAFWRETGATYRPHPREEDKLSRVQHTLWRRMGMAFDEGAALAEIDRPVVAAFSTGVLEAATRGIPSWVFHLNPPAWLREMWERYSLARWGQPPTSRPTHMPDAMKRILKEAT